MRRSIVLNLPLKLLIPDSGHRCLTLQGMFNLVSTIFVAIPQKPRAWPLASFNDLSLVNKLRFRKGVFLVAP
jgi:hypothetical protein